MPFFGGPSNDFMLSTAQGVAQCMHEAQIVGALEDSDARMELALALKRKGQPATPQDVLSQAAIAILEMRMGWFKRNQFLGMLEGCFRSSGFSAADSRHFRTTIEELYRHAELLAK